MAEAIGVRQMSVCKAIKELVGAGYIQLANKKLAEDGVISPKQATIARGQYILLSDVYGTKQRSGVQEIVSSPRGHRRLVSAAS